MRYNMPIRKFILLTIIISLLACACSAFAAKNTKPKPKPKAIAGPSILVIYDDTGEYGWIGRLCALQLHNLLNHFDAVVTKKTTAAYQSGDIARYDAAFYIGALWDEPIKDVMKSDVKATTKPFVWISLNLWQLAWDMDTWEPDPAFPAQYGFEFIDYEWQTVHKYVYYKDTRLDKDPYDTELGHIQITNPSKVQIFATCEDEHGGSWPYIVKSGSFWYVADMPMESNTFCNRSLAFADLLHDMLGIDHPENHRAYLRIEDISPIVSSSYLTSVGNALRDLAIPFVVSVIPEYRDPYGYFNRGVPLVMKTPKYPAYVAALKKFLAINGQVLQHGYTHQFENLQNPDYGITGSDYEFFRVGYNAQGEFIPIAPLKTDSAAWARKRVLTGQKMLKDVGLNPVGWLTPHYLASAVDYEQFALIYPFACDRAQLFTTDNDGHLQVVELNSPFVYRDTYGLKRIPETVGYLDPLGMPGQPPSLPADVIERARAQLVVRDGWAGCYYHYFVDTQHLRDMINGIKALGYTFVPLSGDIPY